MTDTDQPGEDMAAEPTHEEAMARLQATLDAIAKGTEDNRKFIEDGVKRDQERAKKENEEQLKKAQERARRLQQIQLGNAETPQGRE